mgnify:CR=1 FL=1
MGKGLRELGYRARHSGGIASRDHDGGLALAGLTAERVLHNLNEAFARGEDGKLAFVLPMADKPMPGIAAEDIGRCAYGLFKGGDAWIGKRVGIAGEHPTGALMAQGLSAALGEEVVYNYVPPEVYRTFGFPGADDLGNMFQYYRDFATEFAAPRSVEVSRSLNPALQSFSAWAQANKDRIPRG